MLSWVLFLSLLSVQSVKIQTGYVLCKVHLQNKLANMANLANLTVCEYLEMATNRRILKESFAEKTSLKSGSISIVYVFACVYAYTCAIFLLFLILSVEEGTTLLTPKKSPFSQELIKLVKFAQLTNLIDPLKRTKIPRFK